MKHTAHVLSYILVEKQLVDKVKNQANTQLSFYSIFVEMYDLIWNGLSSAKLQLAYRYTIK